MRKRFWLGLSAVALLAAAAALAIWGLGEGGGLRDGLAPPVAVAPPPEAAPAPPAAPVEPPAAEPVAEPTPAGLAEERDPRGDVQRPADTRGDLLQEERASKVESAMDQLNRRTQRRKAAMQNIGEVRPGAPAPVAVPGR